MTTTNEPLPGMDLAVQCAEAFGWKVRAWEHYDLKTDTVTPTIQVYKNDNGPWEDWEPWRDPRAWWEVAEKKALSGYAFCLHNQDDNDIWDAAFIDEHGGIHATAQTPGEAVMLAALQAVRAQG